MRLLDKYLLISSVLAIFTEAFTFHYFIDLKLYYIILVLNFFIIASKFKLKVPKNLIIIIGFFLVHGVVNYLLFSNPIQSLIAQLMGISISSVYYFNFIKNYEVNTVFNKYLEISFILALVAIPMYYLNINVFTSGRLNGIMAEPAHYAAIVLPAAYVFLKKKKYLKLIVIVLTIFLSKSSIGFIGLLLIIIVPLMKVKYFLKYSIFVLILVSIGFFYVNIKWDETIDENNSNKVVRRLKQTRESFSAVYTGQFKKQTNLSSYAVLSNAFIVGQVIKNKPLGTGIGSYKHEYEKYYENLKPPKYLRKTKLAKINKNDANSLFLRMIADLGIFSFFFFLFFLYWSIKIFKNDNKTYQQGTFFYLTVKLVREGHYFPPEFYFFLLIFLNKYNENTTYS